MSSSGRPMPFYMCSRHSGLPLALTEEGDPIEGFVWFHGGLCPVGFEAGVGEEDSSALEPGFDWVVPLAEQQEGGAPVEPIPGIAVTSPVPCYLLADGEFYPIACGDNGRPLEGYLRHPEHEDVLVPVGLQVYDPTSGEPVPGLVRLADGAETTGVPAHPGAGWSSHFVDAASQPRPDDLDPPAAEVSLSQTALLSNNSPESHPVSPLRPPPLPTLRPNSPIYSGPKFNSPSVMQSEPLRSDHEYAQPSASPLASAMPISGDMRPMTRQAPPMQTSHMVPVSVQPSPMAVQSSPMAVQSSPMAVQSSPMAVQSSPMAARSSPMAARSMQATASPMYSMQSSAMPVMQSSAMPWSTVQSSTMPMHAIQQTSTVQPPQAMPMAPMQKSPMSAHSSSMPMTTVQAMQQYPGFPATTSMPMEAGQSSMMHSAMQTTTTRQQQPLSMQSSSLVASPASSMHTSGTTLASLRPAVQPMPAISGTRTEMGGPVQSTYMPSQPLPSYGSTTFQASPLSMQPRSTMQVSRNTTPATQAPQPSMINTEPQRLSSAMVTPAQMLPAVAVERQPMPANSIAPSPLGSTSNKSYSLTTQYPHTTTAATTYKPLDTSFGNSYVTRSRSVSVHEPAKVTTTSYTTTTAPAQEYRAPERMTSTYQSTQVYNQQPRQVSVSQMTQPAPSQPQMMRAASVQGSPLATKPYQYETTTTQPQPRFSQVTQVPYSGTSASVVQGSPVSTTMQSSSMAAVSRPPAMAPVQTTTTTVVSQPMAPPVTGAPVTIRALQSSPMVGMVPRNTVAQSDTAPAPAQVLTTTKFNERKAPRSARLNRRTRNNARLRAQKKKQGWSLFSMCNRVDAASAHEEDIMSTSSSSSSSSSSSKIEGHNSYTTVSDEYATESFTAPANQRRIC